jgi:hypothetical protein
MKKLILIALALTLVLGIGWASSVAAVEPVTVTIHKTIPAGGPIETFTFQLYRDMNNNGIIDFVDPWPDILVGEVDIVGGGTGVIYSTVMGVSIIHEVLSPGSVYEQQPDQIVQVYCAVEVTFDNIQKQQDGQLEIRKVDGSGDPLAGACFTITPDPRTGADSLELCDNDANDEDPRDGYFLLTECIIDLVCNVEETTVPPGYEGADPQTVTISATLSVTFANTEEKCELTIYKVDGSGSALAGATFVITPDPKTGTGSLTVVDNGLNDECPEPGVLCLSGLICELTCTVEETVAPTGYEPAPPQTVTIGETAALTFVNTHTPSCGTVCAAQTAPGEYLFGGGQTNWFTYITYNKGWGTELSPKTYPIYTGQTIPAGTLYVYDKLVSAGVTHLFVKYELTDTDSCTLAGISAYHLQVDRTLANLKSAIVNKSGNPVPGKCEYIGTLDPMQPATGWIEATNDNITSWSTPIYIFAHAIGCYYCG